MTLEEIRYSMLIFSMTLPRFFGVFILLPILNKQVLGASLIRNGVICSLAICLFPAIKDITLVKDLHDVELVLVLAKEVLLGVLISFMLAIPFWAIEAVGFFIDNQRGATLASSINPVLGQQSSPTGILMTQTLVTLFFVSGAFMGLIQALYASFIYWPIGTFFPIIGDGWVDFFYSQIEVVLDLLAVMSAPVIVAMFFSEFGLALVSRFAPQLNVFSLAMPVKSGVASFMLIVYIVILMEGFLDKLWELLFFKDLLQPIIGGGI